MSKKTIAKSEHLNAAEAAELLRCSPGTLRRYAREYGFTRVRISQRHILYVREELMDFINKRSYRVHG